MIYQLLSGGGDGVGGPSSVDAALLPSWMRRPEPPAAPPEPFVVPPPPVSPPPPPTSPPPLSPFEDVLEKLRRNVEVLATSPPSAVLPPAFVSALKKYWTLAYESVRTYVVRPALAVLLYKPPFGAVAALEAYKLLFERGGAPSTMGGLLDRGSTQSERRRRKRSGRALDLDSSDRSYDASGGVDPVRADVLRDALARTAERRRRRRAEEEVAAREEGGGGEVGGGGATASGGGATTAEGEATAVRELAALDALRVRCPPRGSRLDFAERLARPLSRLAGALHGDGRPSAPAPPPSRRGVRQSRGTTEGGRSGTVDEAAVLRTAAQLAQVRALDALLRGLRDRLVQSSRRLSRTERQWKSKVLSSRARASAGAPRGERAAGSGGRSSLLRLTVFGVTIGAGGTSLENDRRRSSLASAMARRELDRLGRVQGLLLARPEEMSDSTLLDTTGREDSPQGVNNDIGGASDFGGGQVAAAVGDEWAEDASGWSAEARDLIYEVISRQRAESKAGAPGAAGMDDGPPADAEMAELADWARTGDGGPDGKGWMSALRCIDQMEGSTGWFGMTVGERELLGLSVWSKFGNAFRGVPSSAAAMAAALAVHYAVKPHWKTIVSASRTAMQVAYNVFERRFWAPFRDILLDLLFNSRPRLTDAASLADAELSLDNMLGDLDLPGFGPTISATQRADALAAASRLYEAEVKSGPIRNVLRGKMVNLLLVQVQQLKVEGLMAMGLIDEMVDANRLNVQLLASIPAVLLVAFGSRFFYSAMYSLKSRDLRSTRDVHAKMTDCLLRLERCLLLAAADEPMTADDGGAPPELSKEGAAAEASSYHFQPPATLAGADLGEFTLLVHSYLLLLDYSSPPIPARSCDAVHQELQDLLSRGRFMDTSRQLALLRSITKRHEGLMR